MRLYQQDSAVLMTVPDKNVIKRDNAKLDPGFDGGIAAPLRRSRSFAAECRQCKL